MQTPEEFVWTLYEGMDFWDHSWHDEDATVRLIQARDEEIRADERGRCSAIHATLTDEALVAELVRRGVLRERTGVNEDLCDCPRRRRYVTAWKPAEEITQPKEQKP